MKLDRSVPPELHSVERVRALDRAAIASGIPGATLMGRAGAAAWRVLQRTWPTAARIAVVCGGGNNGGDGYVVARLARTAGVEVRLHALVAPDSLKGDAAAAAAAWRAAGGRTEMALADALTGADVIVDALLGTGFRGAPEGAFAQAIEAMNASGAPILALDVPSGLDADTGAAPGPAIVAAATATFVGVKRGLLTGAAAAHVGLLHFDGLGIPDAVRAGTVVNARRLGAVRPSLPPLAADAHKGRRGRVLVIGGGPGMAGAVVLAGATALRAGAGVVTVATRPEHVAAVVAARPELLCHGIERPEQLRQLQAQADVVLVGPGIGRDAWALALFGTALDARLPLVVDADALALLAQEPERRDAWVLTPHPGEAGRLLGRSAAAVQRDRFAAQAELCSRYGGTVVLKGAGTLVGAADDDLAVCEAGGPWLATAGTGDVLAGIVAAFMAQGLIVPEAARLGVWIHAVAGDEAAAAGGRGVIAGDVIDALPRVLSGLDD